MEPINVVIIDPKGLAKDIHPKGAAPILPIETDFKEKEKFVAAMIAFLTATSDWRTIDSTLGIYPIGSMVTDAGETIQNKVLHWHVGKTYKAVKVEYPFIQII